MISIFLTNDINFLAIIIAAVTAFILGGLWYSQYLFGKKFMQLTGMNSSVLNTEEKAAGKKRANRAMGITFIALLVTAFALERIQYYLIRPRLCFSIGVAIFFWLAFAAATNISEYLYVTKPRPWLLFVLNQAYVLTSFILMTLVIFFI